jgi:pSer/pThr/pTyr-binding forkhead associated (FHA) protein
MILHARLAAPDGSPIGEFVVSTFPARVGRDPGAEIAIDDHRFPVVSGLHAEITRGPAGLVLTSRSPKNLTLLNDRPVGDPLALRPGDRIRLGVTGPTVEIVRIESVEPLPAELPAATGQARRSASHRRAAGWLVAGLALHLFAVYLALVFFGVLSSPLGSRPSTPPAAKKS